MLSFYFPSPDFCSILLSLGQVKIFVFLFLCWFCKLVLISLLMKKASGVICRGLFCSLYLLYNGYDPGVIPNSDTPFEDCINHVIKVCCNHLSKSARLKAVILEHLLKISAILFPSWFDLWIFFPAVFSWGLSVIAYGSLQLLQISKVDYIFYWIMVFILRKLPWFLWCILKYKFVSRWP